MPVFKRKSILAPLLAVIVLTFVTSITFFSALNSTQMLADFPQAEAATISPYVEADGTALSLYGEPYQFTGVNAFHLATLPGVNAGCGGYVDDVDAFFSKLRKNSMVRMWAFQGSMAINPKTKEIDWSGLDRVVNAAQRNNIKLIFVLTEQGGACDDGHWKDLAWYQGDYNKTFNDSGNGLTPIPYIEYVKKIVSRYKDSPAVAMWEPVNEGAPANCTNGKKGDDCWAYQACPDEKVAAQAMKSFFDTVGGTIKSIDPNHLISSGVIGNGQCGGVWENYKFIHDSEGVDVGSYHDYSNIDKPMPGDQWNGLQKRIDQMSLLNKPLIVGEIGMKANASGKGCLTHTSRKDKMKAKMDAQFAAGVDGFIPWSYTGGTTTSCNFDIVADDPLLNLLNTYPVPMGGVAPSPSATPFATPTPTPPDIQPPTAATNLKATNVAPRELTLSWTAATDNEEVSRYDIYRDYWYVTSTTSTTFINKNLLPGTKYMYYIKARDTSDNTSPTSSRLTVTTLYEGPTPVPTPKPTPTPTPPPDTQAPTPPTELTVTSLSPTKVTFQWKAATDNVKVDRYEIYRDYQYVTATTHTSITNQNLKPATKYMFYLKTRDAAGNSSGTSARLTITTPADGPTPTPTPTPSPTPTPAPDTQPPTAPTHLKASSVSPTEVTLSWTASTDNVKVVRYDIFRDYWYVTSTIHTTLTNQKLTPGTKYMYYVKGRDDAGFSSAASNKLTITTPLQ